MSDKGQTEDVDSLENAIAYRVTRAARVLRLHLTRFLEERGIELSPEQYFLLFRLSAAPGQGPRELSDPLLSDYPNTTRLIESLVRRGLVERRAAAGDRRRQELYLTDAGRELADRLVPAVLEERTALYAGFAPAELDAFWKVLVDVEERAAARAGIAAEEKLR